MNNEPLMMMPQRPKSLHKLVDVYDELLTALWKKTIFDFNAIEVSSEKDYVVASLMRINKFIAHENELFLRTLDY